MESRFDRADSSGFTLLEMLVVLALLAVLITVITGTISMGISARSRVTAVVMDHQDFMSFQRIIISKLGRAYPDWISNGAYKSVDFDGNSDSLSFLAPALNSQGFGLTRYQLSLSKYKGQNAILLLTNLSPDQSRPPLTSYFGVGLSAISFEYFGNPANQVNPSWQDSWIGRSTLPDLVAIRVLFPKADRRSWPTLIVHPDIDADVTCEIDVSSHRCAGR